MITLKELAIRSNVSIATVSNILNGKSNVSKETRERVMQIIKETGYKPNYMARGLRASSTKTIGLIVDDITEFSTPKIIDGIMSELKKRDTAPFWKTCVFTQNGNTVKKKSVSINRI